MQLPISLVVITKNEEQKISRCLDSVDFVSEKLIIDSGSTDRTVELAEAHGAKVIQQSWLGFGPQKHFASEKAKCDWILNLDADEVLSNESKSEIISLFIEAGRLNDEVVYLLPRKTFFLGRWIRFGGWYPDYQGRLYNRKHSQWSQAQIHEKVIGGSYVRLQFPLLHQVFENISDQVQANNRYSSLLAAKDHQEGKRFSYLKLVVKPTVKFLECYLLKQGFRDGWPGFIIARNAAYSIFMRQAKLWEIQRLKK